MRMTEKQVEEAFGAYLRGDGWVVSTKNRDYVDLLAKRGSEVIVAELRVIRRAPAWTLIRATASCCAGSTCRNPACGTPWSSLPACAIT